MSSKKSKIQLCITDPTVLKFEVPEVIKRFGFDYSILENVLLNMGCTKSIIQVNCLQDKYFKVDQELNKLSLSAP
jgi:hypothetical protein